MRGSNDNRGGYERLEGEGGILTGRYVKELSPARARTSISASHQLILSSNIRIHNLLAVYWGIAAHTHAMGTHIDTQTPADHRCT